MAVIEPLAATGALRAPTLADPREFVPAGLGPFGSVRVADRAAAVDPVLWRKGFAHLCLDHRYYEIVERTLPEGVDYAYLVHENTDTGQLALQPVFIVDQDVAAGLPGPLQAVLARLRRVFPRLLKLRTLMAGCVAGEGHLGAADDPGWPGEVLPRALLAYARAQRAAIVVLKDFPAEYRARLAPFTWQGYARVASFPAVTLALDFGSFEEYLGTRLGKVTRKNLRRKFRKAALQAPVTMEVLTDASGCVAELYPLYLAVHQRAKFHFEKLTPRYFAEIGRALPDRARFFIWRQNGRMVAFSLCFIHEGVISDFCLGLDYTVAHDLHLYFLTWRGIIEWALKNGLKQYHSGPLNYDPKLHFRCVLAPLDLYTRHTTGWINPLYRLAVRFLGPARHDPVLPRFPNFHEL
jgi:hypothetical protein